MSVYREDSLAARFAALAPEPLQGDWLDVQSRARRSRRRRRALTIAIAAAFAVILIGSALGGRRVFDFFSADPAPHGVVVDFDKAQRAYLADFGTRSPGATAGDRLRTVLKGRWRGNGFDLQAPDVHYSVAVAPADHGNGFCTAFSSGGASGTSCIDAKQRRTEKIVFLTAVPILARNLGPHEFVGAVTASDTSRLVLRYEDGKEDEVPLTWVSKPIDAGFFAFDPAPQHYGEGHRASLFVALDATGREVARLPWTHGPTSDPNWTWRGMGGIGVHGGGWPRAIDKWTAHHLEFPGLPHFIRVTLALGQAGGRCYAFAGGIGGGCVRPGATPQCCESHGAGARGHAGWLTLIHGLAKDDWTVEFRYEDGRVDVVRPREQLIVYAVPPKQYAKDHWLTSVVVRDATGRVVHRDDWDKQWAYYNFHRPPMRWPAES